MTKWAMVWALFVVGMGLAMSCGGSAVLEQAGSQSAGAAGSAGQTNSAGSGAESGMGAGGNGWGVCQHDAECMLTVAGCCGPCEPIPSAAIVALNSRYFPQLSAQSCKESANCGACPSATEYEATFKYFKAVCDSGQCAAIDIRRTALSTCASDADCVLRDGTQCCAECDGSGFVPANKRADWCDGEPTACDSCVSQPPVGLETACLQGHCALALPTR